MVGYAGSLQQLCGGAQDENRFAMSVLILHKLERAPVGRKTVDGLRPIWEDDRVVQDRRRRFRKRVGGKPLAQIGRLTDSLATGWMTPPARDETTLTQKPSGFEIDARRKR